MTTECYPITVLPHISRLYRDYLAMGADHEQLRRWYGAEPFAGSWIGADVRAVDAGQLADALEAQSFGFGAGPAAITNIAKLRTGARAVVTGQQVGLLGGPLLTLLKAATAVARAKQATATSGIEHIPVFWLASEDHDLDEVDHIDLLSKTAVETLRVRHINPSSQPLPVGEVKFDGSINEVLDHVSELLGDAPICDVLRECYHYDPIDSKGPTFSGAFARFMARIFAAEGLIVMDAAGPNFHRLGASTLLYAIKHADELGAALQARVAELEASGYHAQVLVKPGASLLFLVNDTEVEEVKERQALKRLPDGNWKAGKQTYTTPDLLAILDTAPERISPNALLRPVFQDTILPTAAYIGGPSEIAYFAQSAVLYEAIFGVGQITPVLPRLSATLLEPSIAAIVDRHEVQLPDAMTTPEALAQRLGARAMPIEGKRKLAAVGGALDAELTVVTEYLTTMNASLGQSAVVAGNKMRHQMNRLRRMAATFQLQQEASLRKQAEAVTLNLFPSGHPQERVLGGIWFLAKSGETLIQRLVQEAENLCPGHIVIRL